MKRIYILALLPLLATACASITPDSQPQVSATSKTSQGELLFFRRHSLQAKLANAFIGTPNGYFIQLGENQYYGLAVNSGWQNYKVKAHGSLASSLGVNVRPGERICIEARPNHEGLPLLFIPYLNALEPSFVLKETGCPSAAEMSALNKVTQGEAA